MNYILIFLQIVTLLLIDFSKQAILFLIYLLADKANSAMVSKLRGNKYIMKKKCDIRVKLEVTVEH